MQAKNLAIDTGSRSSRIGLKVKELQDALPDARIVYCSATGASEPRNMSYMVRLGLWGKGHSAFPSFKAFLEAVQGYDSEKRGGSTSKIVTLEMVAMDMKAQGVYVCRTLSFNGAEFETVDVPLDDSIAAQYSQAVNLWKKLFHEFQNAETRAEEAMASVSDGSGGMELFRRKRTMATWRAFWGTHQRFFRHMCLAAKVTAAVKMSQDAVKDGKCVVIGLQSTGEARTGDVIAEKGEELDDFVSGPKELLLRLVDGYYPLPPTSLEVQAQKFGADTNDDDDDDEFEGWGVKPVASAAANGTWARRDTIQRKSRRYSIRYKEYDEDEGIGISSSNEEKSDEDESSGASDSESSLEDTGAWETETEEPANDVNDALYENIVSSEAEHQGKSPTFWSNRTETGHGEEPLKQTVKIPPTVYFGAHAEVDLAEEKLELEDKETMTRRTFEIYGNERARLGGESDTGAIEGHVYEIVGDHKLDAYGRVNEISEGEKMVLSENNTRSKGRTDDKGVESPDIEHNDWVERLKALEEALELAKARRKQLIDDISNADLPVNPLDDLIYRLGGPEAVAEMTGRKGRLVRNANGGVKYEPRNASGVAPGSTLELINVHEKDLFLKGVKLIAVISEAASAGISLHADRRAINQRRRVHLTLELPWWVTCSIESKKMLLGVEISHNFFLKGGA